MIGGILLAIVCCFIAFRYSDPFFAFYRFLVVRIAYYLRKPTVPCVNCNTRIKVGSDFSCPHCGIHYGNPVKISSVIDRFKNLFT